MTEQSYDCIRTYTMSRKQLGYSAPMAHKMGPDHSEPTVETFEPDPLAPVKHHAGESIDKLIRDRMDVTGRDYMTEFRAFMSDPRPEHRTLRKFWVHGHE
jgi:hypothetical protein